MPWFFSRDAEGDDDLREALERALLRCQQRLVAEAASAPESSGMGTTLTAAYINWPRATIVHAGDSRCYLWRSGMLTQITTDHTIAQQLSERGGPHLSDDLTHSRWAHLLWNAIGAGTQKVQPEVHQLDLEIGDVLLLCTDGLIRHVEPPQLARRMAKMQSAKQLCNDLINAANECGGVDNITVVVARFVDQDSGLIAAAEEASLEAAVVDSLSDTAPELQAILEPDPAPTPAAQDLLHIKSRIPRPGDH